MPPSRPSGTLRPVVGLSRRSPRPWECFWSSVAGLRTICPVRRFPDLAAGKWLVAQFPAPLGKLLLLPEPADVVLPTADLPLHQVSSLRHDQVATQGRGELRDQPSTYRQVRELSDRGPPGGPAPRGTRSVSRGAGNCATSPPPTARSGSRRRGAPPGGPAPRGTRACSGARGTARQATHLPQGPGRAGRGHPGGAGRPRYARSVMRTAVETGPGAPGVAAWVAAAEAARATVRGR